MTRKLLGLFSLLLAPVLVAQTPCTTANPCVQIPVENSNPLPTQTVLWICQGTATACSQAALTTAMAGQTVSNLCPASSGAWRCVSWSQTKTPQLYNDPEAWASLMNYAAQGSDGTGGVSAPSPIMVFQVPQAPAQVPSIAGFTVVTTGNAGPQ